ncbi:hypothetical protein [Acetobacter fallax]|uniref:Uncharacterized protein n=1 Tax=Acetobacter fallax TaxID=1737473 RepID=A0ABX0KGP6_9PROT|nr:hypothetical protein [Acetobacter fallax]NHO34349.1 hypothetical protein [Acetobacter fallax]NHO37918.1 hypothetical protein [Acetobacter fallax]
MHELLGTSRVQSGIVELLRTGSMAFPSPIDGKAMSARHSLILNRNMYAYRCLDEASGTVMYVIAGEAYLRPVCLFIPEGRLCVSFSVDAIQGQMPGMWQEFANRVVRHGDLLVRYFALKETRPLHAWQGSTSIHLGHILWNDISGIAAMIPQVSDDQLPRFAVYDAADHPEMYGPLDEIFPRLRGLVDRRHTYLEAEIPDFYRRGQVVFRSSSFFVSRMVRDSILACVKPMAPDSPAAVCARAHQAGIPVVMFGLRVENRTVVELEHFCLHRIDCLASSLGRAILVIDGHNSYPGEPENVVWSHGEHGATRPPIVIERDLVAAMQTRAEGTELLIASTIGLPLSESLACGKESDVLVTMWGAGLAKYRWVCNIPGVVLTSKYGLNHRGDLPLYHSPRYMEDASPLAFVPEDMITDAPDAPLLVDLGGVNPSIANFHVDERRAFAFIRAVIERACTTGKQRDEVGGG